MLNQLRFERNDFRKFVVRFHNVIIEKNDVINVLYESKLMIEQANNVVYNYQKNCKIATKNQHHKVIIVEKDSKNDYSHESLKSRLNLIQNLSIIKKKQVYKAI